MRIDHDQRRHVQGERELVAVVVQGARGSQAARSGDAEPLGECVAGGGEDGPATGDRVGQSAKRKFVGGGAAFQ
jgi:hypothetical protein